MKILFVSWDGPQVTYLEGLFLPIFVALQAKGFEFHVVQFTWADAGSIKRTKEVYEAAGVGYRSVRVWRHPKALGAVLTAWWGARQIGRDIHRMGFDVVMPRSILPAFATMLVRGIGKTPIVFDADGLAVDERLEFAAESTSSLQSWVMRDVEVKAVRTSSVVLTRTARAAEILRARAGAGTRTGKFHVVGNGRDPRQFRPFDEATRQGVRARLGIAQDAPLLVYVGSLGEQYCPKQMLQLFTCLRSRRPDARLLVLSKQGDSLLALASQMLLPATSLTVIAVEPGEVPEYLACADVGLALRKPSFSMQGVAPIKLGEYLLCGVPVVVSTVIANAELIDAHTGIRVEGLESASVEKVADWITGQVLGDREGFRQRCVALGRNSFSLDHSVDGYVSALATLRNPSVIDAQSNLADSSVSPRNKEGLGNFIDDAKTSQSPKVPVLYVSYDGMLEPLGQSQVLAYLEQLAKDRQLHLISFEKAEDWANETLRAQVESRMDAAGIRWHPRRYHKTPSSFATAWDIAIGTISTFWLVLRHRIGIIHARSYVSAIMAWLVTGMTGTKFLFDMRGLWADERVDGGLWPRDGRMYRLAKWFERKFFLNADHLVSLTQAGLQEIQSFDYLKGRALPVTVIPTCADLTRFTPLAREESRGFVLGYVGSAGTWYLFDAVVDCFKELRKLRPEARLLIINHNSQEYIRERLAAGGVSAEAYELRAATHSEVPAQMARMDAGIFFYKPSYSRAACSPTKLGEFLGCGIPSLSNTGVGDMAEILEGDRVGVAVESFEPEVLAAGIKRLLSLLDEPDIHKRCVGAARRHFSLAQGVSSYSEIYRILDLAK